MQFCRPAACFLFACLPLGFAQAAGSLLLLDPVPAQSTWSIGPTLRSTPHGVIANSSSLNLIPGFEVDASSGLFVSTDDGIGWDLSSNKDIQAGVRLWPQFGRYASQIPVGITPVGTRIQTEWFGNFQALPALLLQSGFSHGAGRNHEGNQLELGATSGLPLGADLLGIGVAASYANEAWRNSYFGVTPAESGATGLKPWTLGDGWQDVSLTLSMEHRFNAHWSVDGQVLSARLVGAAARSPLTLHRDQRSASLSLWYGF